MSLYTDLKDAGCRLDHHESDLQFLVTPESMEILRQHQKKKGHFLGVEFFTSNEGTRWAETPFLYDPYWEDRR